MVKPIIGDTPDYCRIFTKIPASPAYLEQNCNPVIDKQSQKADNPASLFSLNRHPEDLRR